MFCVNWAVKELCKKAGLDESIIEIIDKQILIYTDENGGWKEYDYEVYNLTDLKLYFDFVRDPVEVDSKEIYAILFLKEIVNEGEEGEGRGHCVFVNYWKTENNYSISDDTGINMINGLDRQQYKIFNNKFIMRFKKRSLLISNDL